MLESLRENLTEAEELGVNALAGLKNRAGQLEDWADDGIGYLRETKSAPLMLGVAVASAGAMALYALYSYWRTPARARKAAKIVTAAAKKEARKGAGRVSRRIAKSAPHKAMEKVARESTTH